MAKLKKVLQAKELELAKSSQVVRRLSFHYSSLARSCRPAVRREEAAKKNEGEEASPDVLLAKTNVLQLWQVKAVEEYIGDSGREVVNEEEDDEDEEEQQDVPQQRLAEQGDVESTDLVVKGARWEQRLQLCLVWESEVHGTVTGLARIKSKEEGKADRVLVSFEDAKLSLLQWNEYEVETISLHYYERDAFKSPFDEANDCSSKAELVVDPASTTAVLRFYRDQLAFLPFASPGSELLDDQNEDDDLDLDYSTDVMKPFYPSFVIDASTLEQPGPIRHIRSMTFLSEYQQPTLALLYESRQTTAAILRDRRDTKSLTALALDLQKRNLTPLYTVHGLPYDTFSVTALPAPMGGVLLLGTNQITHIDQTGSAYTLSVNDFSHESTSFPLKARFKGPNLYLNGAKVCALSETMVLLILADGATLEVTFKLEGRSVRGIQLESVDMGRGRNRSQSIVGGATCITKLTDRTFFVGRHSADATLVAVKELRRDVARRETVVTSGDDIENLYGDADSGANSKSVIGRVYEVNDVLNNYGPLRSLISERFEAKGWSKDTEGLPEVRLVGVTGGGNASALTTIQRTLVPSVVGQFELPGVENLWALSVDRAAGSSNGEAELAKASSRTYLFLTLPTESLLFSVGEIFEELQGTDFEKNNPIITVGVVGDRTTVVHVCPETIIVYDADLNMLQMLPLSNDEVSVRDAIVFDPYVVVILENGTLQIYELNKKSKELVSLSLPKVLQYVTFDSVSLLKSNHFTRGTKRSATDEVLRTGVTDGRTILGYFFSVGQMYIVDMPSNTLLHKGYEFSGLDKVVEAKAVKSERHGLVKCCAMDLGEALFDRYVLVQSALGYVSVYKQYNDRNPFFAKVASFSLRQASEDLSTCKMQSFESISSFRGVVTLGQNSSSFIIRTRHSFPNIYHTTPIKSLSTFSTHEVENGFIYLDFQGKIRICQLAKDTAFDSKMLVSRTQFQKDISFVAHSATKRVFVFASNASQEFLDVDGENYTNGHSKSLPIVQQSSLNVVSGVRGSIMDEYKFEDYEKVLTMKMVRLNIDKIPEKNRELLCVGTGITCGEEITTKGNLYIFEISDVNAAPGQTERNHKLRLIVSENVRGSVSALCEVKGYILSAQGPKIMIRYLTDQYTLVPVAFMDLSTYVTDVKAVRDTIIFGDLLKSIWFAGYSLEPYKMHLFGKDDESVQVEAAEFIISQDVLFFAVATSEKNLLVYTYDPDSPNSMLGHKLLRRADIHSGLDVNGLQIYPSSMTGSPATEFFCIGTTKQGNLVQISRADERVFRQLNLLQGHLTNSLIHVAGLNHRAYRISTNLDKLQNPAKGFVDGNFVHTFLTLPVPKQMELAKRSGSTVDNLSETIISHLHQIDYL